MSTTRYKYDTYSMINLLLSLIGLLFSFLIVVIGLLISQKSIGIIIQEEIYAFYIIVVIYIIPTIIIGFKSFLSGDKNERTALTQVFLWISYAISMVSVILLTTIALDLYLVILSGIIVVGLFLIGVSEADKIARAI